MPSWKNFCYHSVRYCGCILRVFTFWSRDASGVRAFVKPVASLLLGANPLLDAMLAHCLLNPTHGSCLVILVWIYCQDEKITISPIKCQIKTKIVNYISVESISGETRFLQNNSILFHIKHGSMHAPKSRVEFHYEKHVGKGSLPFKNMVIYASYGIVKCFKLALRYTYSWQQNVYSILVS